MRCHTARVATSADTGHSQGFVGRIHELETIRSVIDGACCGRMGALLVSGDAGVGKTRLVEFATATQTEQAGHDRDDLVLVGACLPLSTMSVPLVPLRAALRRAPAELAAPALSEAASGETTGGAPVLIDDWLEQVCGRRPVVLVVDDLQWADESTLDVLMFVLAGSAERRLAVLATLRYGELGTGHPLNRWLADMRRMPCLSELSLGPLTRHETRDQLAAIHGVTPHESLVTEVFTRSGGNAYLNRLIVEALPPGSRHLGADLPGDLRSAVLRAWHRLSPPARELVRVIAVGGEVALGPSLTRAARLAGVDVDDAPRLLREAVDAGLLDVDARGGYWLHHPLQAEALEADLPPGESRRLHAQFAAADEHDLMALLSRTTPEAGGTASGVVEAVTAIADHHHRADHPLEAYRWALRAVDAGERAGAGAERLRLLRRAVSLREHLGDVQESTLDLLLRLRTTAASLGAHEDELAAVEAVLDLVDEADRPLLVAELLVRREHLRFSTGRGFLRVEPARRAVALSEHDHASWQHAYALAELAHASLWHEAPDGHDVARAALETAVAVGDPAALAYACAAAAMSTVFRGDTGGPELAARGVAAATVARDWWGFVHAALWEANGTASNVEPAYAQLLQGRRESLEQLGAPHPYVAWMSADEAGVWLDVGHWEQCSDRLRVALGSDPGAGPDVIARLAATRLAVLQGRQAEAESHLARAEELFADTTDFLAFDFDVVRAMTRLTGGDPSGAVDAAWAGATGAGVPPTRCEWLMPLAARGLADLADGARDRGEPLDAVLARLDELVVRFPRVIRDGAYDSPFYTRQLEGLGALYAAEVTRCRRSAEEADRWTAAADLLEGILPWEEAYAAFRAGESRLVRGQGTREEAAAMLRRAHAVASRLRAEPVLRETADLARVARIPLDDVTPSSPATGVGAAGRPFGITPREAEILDHIVAGRTYGEIARALFLSEKTVSSHVSNLLRKTGTTNRVELARLIRHREGHPH